MLRRKSPRKRRIKIRNIKPPAKLNSKLSSLLQLPQSCLFLILSRLPILEIIRTIPLINKELRGFLEASVQKHETPFGPAFVGEVYTLLRAIARFPQIPRHIKHLYVRNAQDLVDIKPPLYFPKLQSIDCPELTDLEPWRAIQEITGPNFETIKWGASVTWTFAEILETLYNSQEQGQERPTVGTLSDQLRAVAARYPPPRFEYAIIKDLLLSSKTLLWFLNACQVKALINIPPQVARQLRMMALENATCPYLRTLEYGNFIPNAVILPIREENMILPCFPRLKRIVARNGAFLVRKSVAVTTAHHQLVNICCDINGLAAIKDGSSLKRIRLVGFPQLFSCGQLRRVPKSVRSIIFESTQQTDDAEILMHAPALPQLNELVVTLPDCWLYSAASAMARETGFECKAFMSVKFLQLNLQVGNTRYEFHDLLIGLFDYARRLTPNITSLNITCSKLWEIHRAPCLPAVLKSFDALQEITLRLDSINLLYLPDGDLIVPPKLKRFWIFCGGPDRSYGWAKVACYSGDVKMRLDRNLSGEHHAVWTSSE